MGVWLSGSVTRTGFDFSLSPRFSATVAMISAAAPNEPQAGSATTSRAVLNTESQMLLRSSGRQCPGINHLHVRLPPSRAMAAALQRDGTMVPIATTVTSLPGRRTTACPKRTR